MATEPEHHVMVDIETLDTKPTGVILSVAAVEFDPYEPNPTNRVVADFHINIRQQIAEGRTRSGDTALWWQEQSIEAQMDVLNGQKNAVSPHEARDIINQIVQGEYSNLWANGPDFDFVLLSNFVGDKYKWPFWKHRCVRTLKNMVDVSNVVFVGARHNALADCHYQIAQVRAAYKLLGLKP